VHCGTHEYRASHGAFSLGERIAGGCHSSELEGAVIEGELSVTREAACPPTLWV
jgi:hypothetical protein